MNKSILPVLIIGSALLVSAVIVFDLHSMGLIFDEIFRALGYLLIAGVVWFAWNTASDSASGSNSETVLWKGFLWCAGIALFASVSLGSPTCIDSDQDIRGTNCYEYADGGYEPTTKQRVAKFAYFMTLLYVPVAIGAFSRRSSS